LTVCAFIAVAAALLSGLAMSAAAEERLIVYAVNYSVAYPLGVGEGRLQRRRELSRAQETRAVAGFAALLATPFA